MGSPFPLIDQLQARLSLYGGELAQMPGQGLVSLVLGLPEAPLRAPRLPGPQFQLMHPQGEELKAGYGIAAEWRASGGRRLLALRDQALALASGWRRIDPENTGCGGFAFLGFAARPQPGGEPGPDDLPNALLRVPEIALRTRRGQAALVLNARLPVKQPAPLIARWLAQLEQLVPALYRPVPPPHCSDPPAPGGSELGGGGEGGPSIPVALEDSLDTPGPAAWRRLLRSALDQIANQQFQKVVIARRRRILGSRPFDIDRLLASLADSYPSCQIFSLHHGKGCFVAATPERLLRLKGNRVEVDALAGTTSRAAEAGRDGALAQALRGSAKNLHEHRLVIDAIRDALAQLTTAIEIPAEPDIMRLANVHHLWTRIGAQFDTPMDVFTLAELLHPTPATNGEPRHEARAWLTRCDPFERGWYTGAAGIVEPDLSGELWVLLRCADIRERTADLYAGAGIVEGSDPALEWREVEHKLCAMLTALRRA